MIRVITILLLVTTFGLANDEDDLAAMIERNQQGVVNIQSSSFVTSYSYYGNGYDDFFSDFFGMRPQRRKQTSLGSGFLIDSEGRVVTNNHVIANADEVVVLFGNAKNPTQIKAKILGSDSVVDLALLQMVKSPAGLKPLPLGDSDKMKVGNTVIAMGNPFGLSGTVTRGIISSLHRTIGAGPYDDFLQTDASINVGNSGGPLFNLKGEVIGINTAINAKGQGIGFAIPINLAKELIPQLQKQGRVIRGWLGIVGENNMPVFQMQYGIPSDPGVVVTSTIARFGAKNADLRAGDVVTQINGKKVEDIYDLQRLVQMEKPGATVDVTVRRTFRGKATTLQKKVKVSELPASEKLPDGYNFM